MASVTKNHSLSIFPTTKSHCLWLASLYYLFLLYQNKIREVLSLGNEGKISILSNKHYGLKVEIKCQPQPDGLYSIYQMSQFLPLNKSLIEMSSKVFVSELANNLVLLLY